MMSILGILILVIMTLAPGALVAYLLLRGKQIASLAEKSESGVIAQTNMSRFKKRVTLTYGLVYLVYSTAIYLGVFEGYVFGHMKVVSEGTTAVILLALLAYGVSPIVALFLYSRRAARTKTAKPSP